MRVHILLEEKLNASLIPAALPIYKVWNRLVMQLTLSSLPVIPSTDVQASSHILPAINKCNHGKQLFGIHPRNQKRKTRRNIDKCVCMNEIHQRSFDLF
jgi:hypothetical protein